MLRGSDLEQDKEPLWNSKYTLITISTFFLLFGHNLLTPTLPLYFNRLGYTESAIGFIIGLAAISSLIVRPFVGRALDNLNRNKVYILGLAILAFSCFLYSYLILLFLFLLLRLIHGIGFGIATTASGTIAVDALPKKHMVKGMIYYHLAPTFAMALGPALGLFLIDRYSFPLMFTYAAVFSTLAVFFTMFISSARQEHKQKGLKMSLFEPSVFRPALVVFLVVTSFSSIMFYITLFAASQGIENIGLFFTFYAVTIIITRPVAGLIIDRKGYDYVLIVSILLFGVALLMLSFADRLSLIIICAIISGIGVGNIFPIMQVLALKDIPYNRRGAATSTFFNAFDLGIGFGSMLWGVVSQYSGYSFMYLLAVLPVTAALIYYVKSNNLA